MLIQDKRHRVTRSEANLYSLFQKATKGDVRAISEAYEIGKEIGLNINPSRAMKVIVQFVEFDGKGGVKKCDP